MTNADRIRNMSDEELAEFMGENTSYYYCGVRCKDRPNSPTDGCRVVAQKEFGE